MRGVQVAVAVSLTLLGCRFDLPSAIVDGSPGVIDGSPDAPSAAACLTDPTYSDNGGRRYKVIAVDVDYDTAIDRCAADGAHPAVIESMQENQYLATLSSAAGAWIGLDDLTAEGTFRWVTGSTSTFRSFLAAEPNNNMGEDCTLLQSTGGWNDVACESAQRAICECDPAYRPPPTPLCRTLPTGFVVQSGRRLFLRATPRAWQSAEDDCRSIGAHLLVIGDADEDSELDARLAGAHWIGYTDVASEGQFRWVDNSPSMFQRWPGGTAPVDDVLDCAILQDLGTWANVACGDMHPYACECDPAPP